MSLGTVLSLDLHASLNIFVAALLAVFVVLRLYPNANEQVRGWVARHPRPWLALMGTVHGTSTLGGALLLIFAASRFRNKEDIRALLAFCYAWFAAIQLTVLAVVTPSAFGWSQVGYAGVAAIVFLLVDSASSMGVGASVRSALDARGPARTQDCSDYAPWASSDARTNRPRRQERARAERTTT